MLDPTATSVSRRRLLRGLFFSGGAIALTRFLPACGGDLPQPPLQGLPNVPGGPGAPSGELSIPSGPLSGIGPLGAPDLDGVAVPEGFTVRAVARTGLPPVIGSLYPWHIFPDGGATFARPEGGWVYTSNSEVPGGAGGCGALVFNADGTLVNAYSILSNTSTNCAGGRTPWATWLSCEETDSGQVWETDPFGINAAQAKPALGRFAHEATATDLRHRTVYLTEDAGSGRFYRFVADPSDVIDGGARLALQSGVLQVMNIEGFEDGGYPEVEDVRKLRRVTWRNVESPAEPQGAVRSQIESAGLGAPGTQFKGGEGLWHHELPAAAQTIPGGGSVPTRGIIFWSTKGDNRVWALDVENQLVELIFDNEQIEPDFDDVDNVVMSPAGDIIVVEDYGAGDRPIRIMVLVPNQPAKVLVEANQPGSEMTGPAFSPDGSRMYFSSQRGPQIPGGQLLIPPGAPGSGLGVTYELLIPPQFRGK